MRKTFVGILFILLFASPCFGMKQIITGGVNDTLSNAATEYNVICGGAGWNTAANRRQIMTTTSGGTFRNLKVSLSGAPGAGTTYTISLDVNGIASALSIPISGTATQGSDTDSVSVSQGNIIRLSCVPSGAAAAVAAHWTVEFEGNTANESLVMGGHSFTMANETAEHLVYGYKGAYHLSNQTMPTSGTIKNLYVVLTGNEAAGATRSYTVFKNGVATSITVSISGGSSSGSDTSNTATFVAGDQIYISRQTTAGTPDTGIGAQTGLTFVANTNGESIIMSGNEGDNLPRNGITEFTTPAADANYTWSATEADRDTLGQDDSGSANAVLKNLYATMDAGPGTGNSMTFTIRQDTNDTNIVATISGTSTTGSDTTNTYTMVDFDLLSVECTASATTSGFPDGWVGVVCYIAPSTAPAFSFSHMDDDNIGISNQ